jgi:hypothetical protein
VTAYGVDGSGQEERVLGAALFYFQNFIIIIRGFVFYEFYGLLRV